MSGREFRPKRWERKTNVARARVRLGGEGEVSYLPVAGGMVDLGRRAWTLLQRDGQSADFGRVAAELGVDRQTVVSATAEYVKAKATEQSPDRELIERARLGNPERFHEVAEAVRLGGEAGKEALERLAREWGVFPESGSDDLMDVACSAGVLPGDRDEALADSGVVVEIEQWLRDRGRELDAEGERGDMTVIESAQASDTVGHGRTPSDEAPHPAWCPTDHSGEVTEFDGFTIGTLHERVLAEVTGDHAAWTDKQATTRVYVEQSDEAGLVVTPTRVVLCVAEGEGSYHGGEGTEAWTGTPEQAEQLAAALLDGARLVRTGKVGRRRLVRVAVRLSNAADWLCGLFGGKGRESP